MTSVERTALRALRPLLGPGEEIVAAVDMWPYRAVRDGVARVVRGPIPGLLSAGLFAAGQVGRLARRRGVDADEAGLQLRRGPATVVVTGERLLVFELARSGNFDGLLVDQPLANVSLTYREPWHSWEPRQYRFQLGELGDWHAQPQLTTKRTALAALESQLAATETPRR